MNYILTSNLSHRNPLACHQRPPTPQSLRSCHSRSSCDSVSSPTAWTGYAQRV